MGPGLRGDYGLPVERIAGNELELVAAELPHPVAGVALVLIGLILGDQYLVGARVAQDSSWIGADLQRDPELDLSAHVELYD